MLAASAPLFGGIAHAPSQSAGRQRTKLVHGRFAVRAIAMVRGGSPMSTQALPYRQADFEGCKETCDLVMKGGITSGVVYPLTAVELAKKYRFSSIGGTSAGAIAAAITAAAEYNRADGGFLRMAELPEELGRDLLRLFQPAPKLRPLFKLFLALAEPTALWRRCITGVGIALSGYPLCSAAGAFPGIAVIVVAVLAHALSWSLVGLALLILLLGTVAGIASGLYRSISKELPAHEFGLCPGVRQPGYDNAAVTEWLADAIDRIAGRKTDGSDAPLTFGDLAHRDHGEMPIELSMMTTNLMMRRPYKLPMHERTYLFKKSDFRRLLPQRLYDFIVSKAEPFDTGNEADDYCHLPVGDDMPIALAARMSLSFPLLISAIPLYARDFTLLQETDRATPQRCLFSDGGLSSNFPIHFFDRLWPNTPTFGISLETFDERRHAGRARTWMPSSSGSGVLLPIQAIQGGVIGFLSRLVDAAKDWQDNLQSTLPGYRERIVHITLKDDEGGLNLSMDPQRIHTLSEYGAQAGKLAASEFNLDGHRWRRFLVAMAALEKTLDNLVTAYDANEDGSESFGDFLERYPQVAESYRQDSHHLETLMQRAQELVELGHRWREVPTIRSGDIPHPDTDLRATAKP
jgi:predicted acylesterase/phospholipase RssA